MTRRKIPQSVSMSRVLTRFIDWAAKAPEGAGEYSVQSLIKLMRVRLGMTQAQLAKRSGLTQSHIANIECGNVDVQWGTLQRIFKAMKSSLIIAPILEVGLEEIIRTQARKVALKRVARVTGTMAMEQQRPEESMIEDLVRVETDRLIHARSSEIWEEG